MWPFSGRVMRAWGVGGGGGVGVGSCLANMILDFVNMRSWGGCRNGKTRCLLRVKHIFRSFISFRCCCLSLC